MSNIALEAARLMDALPEADKEFAYEFINKGYEPRRMRRGMVLERR